MAPPIVLKLTGREDTRPEVPALLKSSTRSANVNATAPPNDSPTTMARRLSGAARSTTSARSAASRSKFSALSRSAYVTTLNERASSGTCR